MPQLPQLTVPALFETVVRLVRGVFNLGRVIAFLNAVQAAAAIAYVHDVRVGQFALRAFDLHVNSKGQPIYSTAPKRRTTNEKESASCACFG